ncbi:hypothetical protein [Vibrio hepatarius]|uniref:hypothetical protein n=1 Tax=Vibrio hepatarius TaxID=171383 RepID=UPI0037360787
MHNLAVNLERSAALFPTKATLRIGDGDISFSLLTQQLNHDATNTLPMTKTGKILKRGTSCIKYRGGR